MIFLSTPTRQYASLFLFLLYFLQFSLAYCYDPISIVQSGCKCKGLYRQKKIFQMTLSDSKLPSRRITWKGEARSSIIVKPNQRTVEEYMALPPEKYSILAQDQIIRLSGNEFRANLPCLNFFGYKIHPIVFATVSVFPDQFKSVINVTRAELEGNAPLLKEINGAFQISVVNTVYADKDSNGFNRLNSNTSLLIDTVVPSITLVPLPIIRNGGNLIIQASLKAAVATFIRILASDFKRWSSGNDERIALEGAKLELE